MSGPVDVLAYLDGLATQHAFKCRAAVAELIAAHRRLLASHKDYTDSQARGWPENPNGYPDHAWSVDIEKQAVAALARVGGAA